MRVLLAEDSEINGEYVEALLKKEGFEVDRVLDGEAAIAQLSRARYDVLLVDWMMPKVDGIAVIRHARQHLDPCPAIIMLTAMDDGTAREYAINSGADHFMAKPAQRSDLLHGIQQTVARRKAGTDVPDTGPPTNSLAVVPNTLNVPCVAVAIAGSTGAPPAVMQVLEQVQFSRREVAVFVALHGPSWMHDALAQRIGQATSWPCVVPEHGEMLKPGHIYVAGRDRHLSISRDLRLQLDASEAINFSRPSADPLFTSMAQVFGPNCVGLVLTGLGRDGARGASHVERVGGQLLVQSPETAIATGMPNAAIASCRAPTVVPLPQVGSTLSELVGRVVGRWRREQGGTLPTEAAP